MRINKDVTITKDGQRYIVKSNNRSFYIFDNKQKAINKYLELKNSITL